jgi:hypothetical protein
MLSPTLARRSEHYVLGRPWPIDTMGDHGGDA